MAMVKRGKRKLAERTVKGANAARRFARKVQNRADAGLLEVLAGRYTTNDLLDDVMEGAADLMDVFRGPAAGAGGGIPTVTFVSTGGALPNRDLVALRLSVPAGQIEKTSLTAIAEVPTVPPAPPGIVPTPTIFPNANYRLRFADHPNAVIPAGSPDEVDEVFVELTAVPAQVGVYRGMLAWQSSDVLAEVVLIVK